MSGNVFVVGLKLEKFVEDKNCSKDEFIVKVVGVVVVGGIVWSLFKFVIRKEKS